MRIEISGDVQATVEIANDRPETIAAAIKAEFEKHPEVSRDTVWTLTESNGNAHTFENNFGHEAVATVV